MSRLSFSVTGLTTSCLGKPWKRKMSEDMSGSEDGYNYVIGRTRNSRTELGCMHVAFVVGAVKGSCLSCCLGCIDETFV